MKRKFVIGIVFILCITTLLPSTTNALMIRYHNDWVQNTLIITLDFVFAKKFNGYNAYDNGTDITANTTQIILPENKVELDVVYPPIVGVHNISFSFRFTSYNDTLVNVRQSVLLHYRILNETATTETATTTPSMENGTISINLPFDVTFVITAFIVTSSLMVLVRRRRRKQQQLR